MGRRSRSLAHPQHGLEALDGAPGRVEAREAADPRHVLQPEMVALDPLLQMLRDVVDGVARQPSLLENRRDGARLRSGPIRADAVGKQQGTVLQHLEENALVGVEVASRGEQKIDSLAVLVDGALQVAHLPRMRTQVSSMRNDPKWALIPYIVVDVHHAALDVVLTLARRRALRVGRVQTPNRGTWLRDDRRCSDCDEEHGRPLVG